MFAYPEGLTRFVLVFLVSLVSDRNSHPNYSHHPRQPRHEQSNGELGAQQRASGVYDLGEPSVDRSTAEHAEHAD